MKLIKKEVSFWICLLILLMFYLQNIDKLRLPAIMLDEIGYWSSAAYWSGYNWSSLMGNFSSYYSYGYSLILYLLMQVFKDVEMLHQAAICVNIIMVVCGYCFLRVVMKKFFSQVSSTILNVGCLVPLFYPSIQYHTQTAWSETYLFFLFLGSVILAIKVFETGKIVFYFLFAVVIVNMYVVHQRSIGILIIGIVYVLLSAVISKTKWRQLIVFFAVLCLCLLGSQQVKRIITENVYTDTTIANISETEESQAEEVDANDFSGQIGKLKYIFSIQGIYNLLVSGFGKIYYFLLASFLLGGSGLFFLGKKIWKALKNKEKINVEIMLAGYILGSYVVTLAVAAIFMIYPGRIDTVAYGRYTDWIAILIATFGVFNLLLSSKKERTKILLGELLFVLIFLLIFHDYIEKNKVSGFFASCSQIMTYFNQKNPATLVYGMTLTMIFVGILINFTTLIKNEYIKCILLAVVSSVMWIMITKPAIVELINIQRVEEIHSITEYIESNKDKEVYYLYNDTSTGRDTLYVGSIQYVLQDRTVRCISDISMIDNDENIIIVSSSFSVPAEYFIEYETSYYKVIKRRK